MVFPYIKDPPLKIAFPIKTSIRNNKKRTDKIYVNILTHLILSRHALRNALIKKYKTKPSIEKNKIPLRIYTCCGVSSPSGFSDIIVFSISVLLSTTGKEA